MIAHPLTLPPPFPAERVAGASTKGEGAREVFPRYALTQRALWVRRGDGKLRNAPSRRSTKNNNAMRDISSNCRSLMASLLALLICLPAALLAEQVVPVQLAALAQELQERQELLALPSCNQRQS
jgi:hypothetical protein